MGYTHVSAHYTYQYKLDPLLEDIRELFRILMQGPVSLIHGYLQGIEVCVVPLGYFHESLCGGGGGVLGGRGEGGREGWGGVR